ncbi:hypothetical protein L7F22_039394 [Adiantum nelumboides]|nr:hypothetical protein [Adiantum nelumboides]
MGTNLDITKDLVSLFEQQAKATPDAIALEDIDKKLTYGQLEEQTRFLAIELQQKYGVKKDSLVGILMGRCADYVIASLAALRAGGAFLVLELAYPEKLLQKVVRDASPNIILTHSKHSSRLPTDFPIKQLDTEKILESNLKLQPSDNDLDRLAFVSYSSGTTGQPKGIANPHRAAVGSYALRFGISDLNPGDRVACNVFFIWEILRPLIRGATTVAVPDSVSYDPEGLVNFLQSREIVDTLMTPTLLATVLASEAKKLQLPKLKSLWLNGEVVTVDLCTRAKAAFPSTHLFNVYSASETHEVAAGEVTDLITKSSAIKNGVCPVGPLLDPKNVFIVDPESDKLVENGSVGELCVGGPLLARGYLNLPEATQKAFLTNKFSPQGGRLYRTGDEARIVEGLLEITGRIGGYIKTRGYTVQPGAVETAITKRLAVRACAVVGHGEGIEKRLVAYIVRDVTATNRPWPNIEQPLGHSPEARRFLTNDLAHYMIPSVWIALDKLPTHTVSGKIDTKALPSPPMTRPGTPVAASASGARQIRVETIIEAWSAALNVPRDAIHVGEADFFDLGGHSLALADLASKLTKAFGFHIPLSALAADASLKGHLAAVTAARDGHLAELQSDLPAIMAADSKLDDEIRYPSSPTPRHRLSDAKTVLLTGATGYLGAFLLRSLIAASSAKIVCLVRFPQPNEKYKPDGLARIRNNLNDLGLWNDSLLDRMEVLPGNLPQTRLGLSEEHFAQLAKRVDIVISCAAIVNLVYPYAALRAANVGGTREILRLAALGGATVHHISSNGALPVTGKPWTESAQITVEEAVQDVPDGYGQTKWVAEQLVLEAQERGIHASIIRPGTLSGCNETGSSNPYDLLNAIVVESLRLGKAPVVEGWRCEMTPVNYVAQAITAICEYDGDGKKDLQTVFHLADPAPLLATKLFELLEASGYKTEKLPWNKWKAIWQESIEERNKDTKLPFTADILKGGMPTTEGLTEAPLLDDAKTRPILEKLGLPRPKIDEQLWHTYLRHFYARGWLPSPPSDAAKKENGVSNGYTNGVAGLNGTTKGRLSGRVAVVTGASSGIGAAVATALAREGAKVAIGARRKDALEKVQKGMIAATLSGRSEKDFVAIPTDVTDAKQVERLVQTANEQLGQVDIVISIAGVMYFTMMANVQTEQWEQTVDVNCKGLLHCLANTVPSMLKNGKGHIVAISSDAGRKVFPGLGVYSASKFFVEATLQALRLETAGKGLRVTAVQPGNVSTDLLNMSTDAEALKQYGEPSGAKVLDAEDVANSIIYALTQPEHVAVNEILIEPRDEPI